MFDPTKPVQTRIGRKARIICTDAKGPHPIVALVDDGDGEVITLYHASGNVAWGGPKERSDLVNIPTKRKVWVNVHSYRSLTSVAGPYDTREEADKAAARYDTRVACAEIEWEEV